MEVETGKTIKKNQLMLHLVILFSSSNRFQQKCVKCVSPEALNIYIYTHTSFFLELQYLTFLKEIDLRDRCLSATLSHQAPQQNHCSTCSRHKAPSHFQAQKCRGLLTLRAQPPSLPDPAAQEVLAQLINHAQHLAASLQHSTGV